REAYFTGTFQELKVPFDASDADTRILSEWFSRNSGLRDGYLEGVEECRAILGRLGAHHAAHLDLGAAYYRDGELAAAEAHVRRALELGFPAPGLAYNYLALIAKARGDLDGMMNAFLTAARTDPQHHVLISNVERARAWFREQGPARNLPLELTARHDFQLFERTEQPTLPGKLADETYDWTVLDEAPGETRPLDSGAILRIDSGNESLPFGQKRLPVI